MKEFLILISFFLSLNVSAFCRTNKPKVLNISSIHEETYDTFSNGKFIIKTNDPNAKVIDFFTKKGFSYEGVLISEKTKKIIDNRFVILKYLFPKEEEYEKNIEIELNDSAIMDVQGINSIELTFLISNNKHKIRTELIFNPDISDNCRAK